MGYRHAVDSAFCAKIIIKKYYKESRWKMKDKIRSGMNIFRAYANRFFKKKIKQFLGFAYCIVPHKKYMVKMGDENILVNYTFGKMKKLFYEVNDHQTLVYFLVDRDCPYMIMCVQAWINICNYLGTRNVFIVCDNKKVEIKIIKNINFHKIKFEFIRSHGKKIINVARLTCRPNWINPACAHIKPLYHAHDNGFDHIWIIDADDTMFLSSARLIAERMQLVENIAIKENIDFYSLDMWESMNGGFWTFGVTYVNDVAEIIKRTENHTINVMKYRVFKQVRSKIINVDGFYADLGKKNIFNIKSFYFRNISFIHWGGIGGDLVREMPTLYQFDEGNIKWPIFEAVPEANKQSVFLNNGIDVI